MHFVVTKTTRLHIYIVTKTARLYCDEDYTSMNMIIIVGHWTGGGDAFLSPLVYEILLLLFLDTGQEGDAFPSPQSYNKD